MAKGRIENLRTPTSAEAREIGRKGGKASGKSRRARKSLRESLIELMSAKIPKDSPFFLRLQADMEAMGLQGDPIVQDLATIGLLKKAAKGDQAAFATLRDTLGEKPIEKQEIVNPPEPIVLGMIPQDLVDKAQKERSDNGK